LSGITPKKIITTDYKKFRFGQFKTGIGVLETVDSQGALLLERKLRKALSEHKKKEKLDLIFLGIVDILKSHTDLLLIGREEEEAARKVFPNAKLEEGMLRLPGVVSRKKQIVPEFEKKLK
jgi:manganese-dependent inorganic pyrophosphatase